MPSMKKTTPNYPNILNEPIVLPSEAALQRLHGMAIKEYISAEHLKRFAALVKHYKIKSNGDVTAGLLELIQKMAADHIDGFQILDKPPRGKGRPSRWQGEDGAKLFVLVEERNRVFRFSRFTLSGMLPPCGSFGELWYALF